MPAPLLESQSPGTENIGVSQYEPKICQKPAKFCNISVFVCDCWCRQFCKQSLAHCSRRNLFLNPRLARKSKQSTKYWRGKICTAYLWTPIFSQFPLALEPQRNKKSVLGDKRHPSLFQTFRQLLMVKGVRSSPGQCPTESQKLGRQVLFVQVMIPASFVEGLIGHKGKKGYAEKILDTKCSSFWVHRSQLTARYSKVYNCYLYMSMDTHKSYSL